MEIVRGTVRNRVVELSYPFPDGLSKEFRFRPKGYFWNPRYKAGYWDGWIRLMTGCSIPTGLFLARHKQIEREWDIRFKLADERLPVTFRVETLKGYDLPSPKYTLWDHQRKAVQRAMQRASIGGIILNATGSGKTILAGAYFAILQGSGIFVVDELTMLYQTKEAFEDVLQEEVGVIGDQEYDPKRITVATVQTLDKYRNDPRFRKLGKECAAMFIDELHLQLNDRTRRMVKTLSPRGVFGLTATLEIEKDHALFPALALTGPVVYSYSYETGVRQRKLAPGVVIGVDVLRQVEFDSEDAYSNIYRDHLVRSPERNACICSLAREALRRGKRTTIIIDRIEHIEILMRELAALRPQAIYGGVPARIRNLTRKRFDAGSLKLLICNRVFRKGVDIKSLEVIIEAAGGRDRNDVQQKYGRGARIVSGKTGLIYFDVGDRAPVRGVNPFRDATLARRRALRELGVTVYSRNWQDNAKALFDVAEEHLKLLTKS